MKTLLPFDLPTSLQRAVFQRFLLSFSLLLMVIVIWMTAHEWESFIGLIGTVYFIYSSFTLITEWRTGKIIAVTGQCVSSDSAVGSIVQAAFSIEGIDESVLTVNIPKKSIKTIPSLYYTLYIRKDNHSILYGIEGVGASKKNNNHF